MTRRRFVAALAAGLGVLVSACLPGSTATPAEGTPTAPAPSPGSTSDPTASLPPPSPSPGATPTSTAAATAALRRKIGRMLVVGFRGTAPASGEPFMQALSKGELGGVILFDRDTLTASVGRNISAPDQLGALTDTLRSTALRGAIGPRLLIAVDQEGGRVARLNPGNGYPAVPSEAELGAANDLTRTTDAAILTGITLAGAGIDFNLAPVVDLNVNPSNPAIGALERSFSADAAIVVAHASAVIEAQQGAGIKMAIKHFPGEGSATGNTDNGIVDVTSTWSPKELEPFRALIAAGLPDAVMVGHIINGQIDADRPAALSRAVIDGVLRSEFGWRGVVISDDLQAPAITRQYGEGESIALAIEAGVDLLLFANQQVYDADIVEHVLAMVVDLVASGRISESRIDESVDRIEGLFSTVE
ncbi:MAG: glycoside hydrolase family 3 N-terminal domain-containing protein [Chloroflexota bacterium]